MYLNGNQAKPCFIILILSLLPLVAILVIDDVEVREEAGEAIVTIRKVGGAGFVINFDVETRAFTGSGAGATGQLRRITYNWYELPVYHIYSTRDVIDLSICDQFFDEVKLHTVAMMTPQS